MSFGFLYFHSFTWPTKPEVTLSSEKIDMEHLSPKNYVQIWIVLVVLLSVSMLFGLLKSATIATVLIFGVAFIKATLVIAYFMHLKVEYIWIKIFFSFGLLCAVFFFIGVYPDIGISMFFNK